jgi:hypothetical protein
MVRCTVAGEAPGDPFYEQPYARRKQAIAPTEDRDGRQKWRKSRAGPEQRSSAGSPAMWSRVLDLLKIAVLV